ncbi:hypothetical protein RJ639_030787 [Escallonia herrerae]|uniref:AB hydrolase-1 domain-containing protein n=1 Tax=Escallonia herrerae TaxID=1293975 RepID=A0AA88XDB5_9ASTE|nr:hypothetical protein RJ639_030787 [Escallonia herrerae]
MASSAIFHSSLSSFALRCKTHQPSSSHYAFFQKPLTVKASASVHYSTASSITGNKSSTALKVNKWEWKYNNEPINIYYEEHEKESTEPTRNILMIPTISDVSTVEEWRLVARDIVQRVGNVNWRATIVDWPGLGYSDRPKLDYNADVMEKFLVDLINAPSGPVSGSGNNLVVFGGGHAATIAVRAAKKGLVKPIYGLLRKTLRAPAVGWMMYNLLVSNEKAIQSQYKSHVYADSGNVKPDIESRYELTKRKGARFVPAAFLTGLLDPVMSREEFLELFAALEDKIPVLVMSTAGAPKRSKAEMEALREAKGVSKFVEVPGALLPQEEYPKTVAEELYSLPLKLLSGLETKLRNFVEETVVMDCGGERQIQAFDKLL